MGYIDMMNAAALVSIRQTLTFWLAEHPSIVEFRWSTDQPWGSTWSFLFTSITLYIASATSLHLLLLLSLPRSRGIPLGPLPALYSLLMALLSATIFAGTLFSATTEIRETRWLWRRSKTPLQWLLCFPLGTRPSGRVFFWSYAFYLSRFLRLLRTFFAVLRRQHLSYFHLFNHSILIVMSFLWLEFSQSFQVLSIVFTTLVSSAVYAYRFWTAIGLPGDCFPFEVSCQFVLLGCNLVCHVGVLTMHFFNGGCNGIGAWGLNSILNGAIMFLFLHFYLKGKTRKDKGVDCMSATTSAVEVMVAPASVDAGVTSSPARPHYYQGS